MCNDWSTWYEPYFRMIHECDVRGIQFWVGAPDTKDAGPFGGGCFSLLSPSVRASLVDELHRPNYLKGDVDQLLMPKVIKPDSRVPNDLQGDWVMTLEELNGQRDTITVKRQVSISGGDFVMSRTRNGTNGVYTGKIQVDSRNRWFDFSGNGPKRSRSRV